jgi:hypothetical protein
MLSGSRPGEADQVGTFSSGVVGIAPFSLNQERPQQVRITFMTVYLFSE